MEYTNKEILLSIVSTKMPYGKFKDKLLCDIPMYYLEWMNRTSFPKGKLGIKLETMYEIKLNGLEHLLIPLKK